MTGRTESRIWAKACVIRHLCRCCRGSERPVSGFPLNRQSFSIFHLFQVTGILPALSMTLFGVSRCVSYLYCSCVFWATLFGVWLCLQLISFLCFLGTLRGVFCVCYLYRSCISYRRCLVCACACYLHRSCVVWEKKMVQHIMEVVAEYEDRLRKIHLLPRFSYGRRMLPKDGAPNTIFLTYLENVGLIRSKVQCNICEKSCPSSRAPIGPV